MRPIQHSIAALFLAILASIALVGCAPETEDDTALTATVAPQDTIVTGTTATTATTDTAVQDPGHQAFLALRCEMCHSVATAGITGTTETGPDLAGVSTRRPGEDLAAFISGDDHPGGWKGTPEQATQIATWIALQ